MAKVEYKLKGDFDELLQIMNDGILKGSMSATLEDGSDFSASGFRCAVRVYERYSMMGKNRVSLSLTLIGDGKEAFLSAITSGGSQAVFFKFNTFGEEAFLDKLRDIAERYKA